MYFLPGSFLDNLRRQKKRGRKGKGGREAGSYFISLSLDCSSSYEWYSQVLNLDATTNCKKKKYLHTLTNVVILRSISMYKQSRFSDAFLAD